MYLHGISNNLILLKLIIIWSNFVFLLLSICMNILLTSLLVLSVSKIYCVLNCLNWPLCIIQHTFGVSSLQQKDDVRKLASAIYLQVSTISQALIFVTRSRNWSFVERPGLLLVAAFVIAQLVSEQLVFTCILWFCLLMYGKYQSINFLLCAVCHTDCCICKLELCCNSRNWMGLGWCCLAL